MKIALILHGNLRTFLMPTRENPQLRVCDIFKNKIIIPNSPDVFIVTEANDFYYDGTQYCNRLEIANSDGFRIHDKVAYVSNEDARKIIEEQLKRELGERIKDMVVEDHISDVSSDPKFQKLNNSDAKGCSPALIVKQHKKVQSAYKMMLRNETTPYDLVIKCRFDTMYDSNPLKLREYDYFNVDVYVPGSKGPIIYDWLAFGRRANMIDYLNLYDWLGWPIDKKAYSVECRKCGNQLMETPAHEILNIVCPHCNNSDNVAFNEITSSSEYHIYSMFRERQIKYASSGHHMYIYRYKDTANNDIHQVFRTVDLNNITVVNHTMDRAMDQIK